MASLFTHALVGVALGGATKPQLSHPRTFLGIAAVCSMLPDIDVIGFRFGIHYLDLWGHRGMTHSLFFAAVIAVVIAALLRETVLKRVILAMLLFLITASHGVLDAMTNGGLGIAFFAPFNLQRYFFSWRPIAVSPLGAHRFFSMRGIHVLWTELLCIWLPTLLFAAFIAWIRLRRESALFR
jgi:inner membrane protein